MIRKRKNKFILIIVFVFIFLIYIKNDVFFSEEVIKDDIISNNITPILVTELIIPKINLKEKLYPSNKDENTVNKHIEIIFPSIMPDNKNSLLVLAAHSGNSNVSFFKNLSNLNKNDEASLHYKNKIYNYIVIKKENQIKNGFIKVKKLKNKTTMILTTCNQKNKSKQIVIYLELKEIKNNV